LPDAIADTSPLQYLHQIGKLDLLPRLVQRVLIPHAVVAELAEGRVRGLNLPDPATLKWAELRSPAGRPKLPLATELGPGETEVLALGLEERSATLILDDGVARRVAQTLALKFTGTLGLLIDAKRAGLIDAVAPVLDELQTLGFRVAPRTRAAVLRFAGEP
jgi:predicted nucleic acid-binding protein